MRWRKILFLAEKAANSISERDQKKRLGRGEKLEGRGGEAQKSNSPPSHKTASLSRLPTGYNYVLKCNSAICY